MTSRPRLHKVILLNDDFTPRDFVVKVLGTVFRMTPAQAQGVMLTAHRRGVCVVRCLHAGDRRDQGRSGNRHGAARGASPDLHHGPRGLKPEAG